MSDRLSITCWTLPNIEPNITDVNLSRLQQIADTLEVSLLKLLDFDEKNIIERNNNNQNNKSCNFYTSDQMLTQENAFLKEKIKDQQTEIENLKEIVTLLREKKG